MDHPMAHGGGPWKAQSLRGGECCLHRHHMAGKIPMSLPQACVVRTPEPQVSTVKANALHGAFGELHFCLLPEVVECKLQRRRAAVEAQNGVSIRWRFRLHAFSSGVIGLCRAAPPAAAASWPHVQPLIWAPDRRTCRKGPGRRTASIHRESVSAARSPPSHALARASSDGT